MKRGQWAGGRATKARALLQSRIDNLQAMCAKCGHAVLPGQAWDVDHRVNRDQDPSLTWESGNWAVAHRSCNRSAGAKYGNRKRGHRDRPPDLIPPPSRPW